MKYTLKSLGTNRGSLFFGFLGLVLGLVFVIFINAFSFIMKLLFDGTTNLEILSAISLGEGWGLMSVVSYALIGFLIGFSTSFVMIFLSNVFMKKFDLLVLDLEEIQQIEKVSKKEQVNEQQEQVEQQQEQVVTQQ